MERKVGHDKETGTMFYCMLWGFLLVVTGTEELEISMEIIV